MSKLVIAVDRSSYTAILDRLIGLADKHQAADEYQAGRYTWGYGGDGKLGACGIGCLNHDAYVLGIWQCDPYDHKALGEALGTGWWVPLMIDHLFESLPQADRPSLVPRVLRGIKSAHKRGADFERIAQTHTSRYLERCLGYVGIGDEPWRVEVRAVVTISRDATAAGRWITEAESDRAFAAGCTARSARSARSAWSGSAAAAADAAAAAGFGSGSGSGSAARSAARSAEAAVAAVAEIAAQRDDFLEGLEGTK